MEGDLDILAAFENPHGAAIEDSIHSYFKSFVKACTILASDLLAKDCGVSTNFFVVNVNIGMNLRPTFSILGHALDATILTAIIPMGRGIETSCRLPLWRSGTVNSSDESSLMA
jgi:hypothetical protein